MTHLAIFLGICAGFLFGFMAGFVFLAAAQEKIKRRDTKSFPVSDLTPSGLSAFNPLSGRRRGEPLPVHQLPKGVEAHPVGNQVVLTGPRNETLLVGENDRGGYGFKTPHELRWHGNYATLTDAVRAAARDGFRA